MAAAHSLPRLGWQKLKHGFSDESVQRILLYLIIISKNAEQISIHNYY